MLERIKVKLSFWEKTTIDVLIRNGCGMSRKDYFDFHNPNFNLESLYPGKFRERAKSLREFYDKVMGGRKYSWFYTAPGGPYLQNALHNSKCYLCPCALLLYVPCFSKHTPQGRVPFAES